MDTSGGYGAGAGLPSQGRIIAGPSRLPAYGGAPTGFGLDSPASQRVSEGSLRKGQPEAGLKGARESLCHGTQQVANFRWPQMANFKWPLTLREQA